jgi:hypothetical protein
MIILVEARQHSLLARREEGSALEPSGKELFQHFFGDSVGFGSMRGPVIQVTRVRILLQKVAGFSLRSISTATCWPTRVVR